MDRWWENKVGISEIIVDVVTSGEPDSEQAKPESWGGIGRQLGTHGAKFPSTSGEEICCFARVVSPYPCNSGSRISR
jgi:hypothetical protein